MFRVRVLRTGRPGAENGSEGPQTATYREDFTRWSLYSDCRPMRNRDSSWFESTAREAKEVRRKLDLPSRGANRLVCPPGVSEGSL
jgi:hypothetical protein